MNKNSKNISKHFAKSLPKKYTENDFYIASTALTKENKKNDTIWLLLSFLILMDM